MNKGRKVGRKIFQVKTMFYTCLLKKITISSRHLPLLFLSSLFYTLNFITVESVTSNWEVAPQWIILYCSTEEWRQWLNVKFSPDTWWSHIKLPLPTGYLTAVCLDVTFKSMWSIRIEYQFATKRCFWGVRNFRPKIALDITLKDFWWANCKY